MVAEVQYSRLDTGGAVNNDISKRQQRLITELESHIYLFNSVEINSVQCHNMPET